MPGNLKTQQTPVILDCVCVKLRQGKYHDYHNIIVFEKRLLEILSVPDTKTQCQRFQIPPV